MQNKQKHKISLIYYPGWGYHPLRIGAPRGTGILVFITFSVKKQNHPFKYLLSINKWLWRDFGHSGRKDRGHILDFIEELKGLDFKNALGFVRQIYQGDLSERPSFNTNQKRRKDQTKPFPFIDHLESQQDQSKLELLKVQAIQNPAIFNYLESRGIGSSLASRYFQEIKYLNRKKNSVYYGFGMANESGWYEIRSASHQYPFKSVLGSKDVTLIVGTDRSEPQVHIFEGMIDAVSLVAIKQSIVFEDDILILHSTSMRKKALNIIATKNYQRIKTYMDNDETGQGNTIKFKEAFPGRVTAMNDHFAEYNDLNDYLVEQLHLRHNLRGEPNFSPS